MCSFKLELYSIVLHQKMQQQLPNIIYQIPNTAHHINHHSLPKLPVLQFEPRKNHRVSVWGSGRCSHDWVILGPRYHFTKATHQSRQCGFFSNTIR